MPIQWNIQKLFTFNLVIDITHEYLYAIQCIVCDVWHRRLVYTLLEIVKKLNKWQVLEVNRWPITNQGINY